jgi:glycosyltransferase involved in cell wall biosynthesis
MKLAILGTRGIPARYGGFETFAEELSVRLAQRGIDVTVYCEADDQERPDTYKGVRLVYLSALRMGPLTTILFDLRCLWHARKGFDVVYMLGYGASIFCFLPRLWGSKVWINMDGVEWARAKWGLLAKTWLKTMEAAAMWTADHLIADADGIQQHLRSRHWHTPSCTVIPYGAPVAAEAPDPRLLQEWGLLPGAYYLIVCRLEPENQVFEIVEGFSRSVASHPLIVVGNYNGGSGYGERLSRMAGRRVRFIGTLYDSSKLQAMRYHALAYFHGHMVGGTNPSLLEALGCGNTVIAHDNVFNREVAGNAAFYFKEAGDIPAIIETIETFSLDDKNKRKTMAQDRVRRHYNWNDITERYYRLLRSKS